MEKKLKVTGIGATNFKGIESINITLDRDHTKIIGANGAGKTTLKEIIQACISGPGRQNISGLTGERFRYIGKSGTAADTRITLQDEEKNITVIVTNHITEKGNDINIASSDGTKLTKEWLKDFFNAAFLSTESFLSHTPKEQALLLGIDPSEFDDKIAGIKEIAKTIRSKIKLIGEPETLNEVKKVDVHALYAESKRIEDHNGDQETISQEIEAQRTEIFNCESNVNRLKEGLKLAEQALIDNADYLKKMPQPKPQLSLDEVTAQIATADETNRAAEAYEANEKKRTDKQAAEKDLQKTQDDIKKIDSKRTEYIKKFKLPVDGLSICDEGGLLLDDKRLRSLSTGEQVIIVTKLLASQNPNYKTVWHDNFETLDTKNQKEIADYIISEGFNLVTTEVGEESKGDGSILLKDCAIA